MFDIGWTEILILAVVSLFVIGPKDIPKFLGYIGRLIGKIRGITSDFRETVDDAIKNSELEDIRKEISFTDPELSKNFNEIINPSTKKNDLKEYHRSDTFDHSNIKSDPFSVLPIPHLLDLVKEGFIKSVNKRHISLMGSIISPSKLINESIPKIIEIFNEDKVDIAIFIPV